MTDPRWRVEPGAARAVLAELPDACVQACITKPPPWAQGENRRQPEVWGGQPGCRHHWTRPDAGLGTAPLAGSRAPAQPHSHRTRALGGEVCHRCGAWHGCLGDEPTPELYVQHLIEVMRAVRRVLRADGTVWLVLDDTLAHDHPIHRAAGASGVAPGHARRVRPATASKGVLGIPWRVALALRADGWWLRSDVVWAKPGQLSERVRDRPRRAHEYVFLLAHQPGYFYDPDAIRAPISGGNPRRCRRERQRERRASARDRGRRCASPPADGSVWWIGAGGCPHGRGPGLPERLVERCVLAGTAGACCGICGTPSRPGSGSQPRPGCEHLNASGRCLVLDPFCGSGTVGVVAVRHDRAFLGIDPDPDTIGRARRRIAHEQETIR